MNETAEEKPTLFSRIMEILLLILVASAIIYVVKQTFFVKNDVDAVLQYYREQIEQQRDSLVKAIERVELLQQDAEHELQRLHNSLEELEIGINEKVREYEEVKHRVDSYTIDSLQLFFTDRYK